jgi:ethanolamine utilization protein EutQ (cupin superfamily)
MTESEITKREAAPGPPPGAASDSVRVFHLSDAPVPAQNRSSALQTYVDHCTNSPFAAGIVTFQDCRTDWHLWYDEILFCHRTERVFSVIVAERRYDLHAGDSVWLPAGTKLTYISEGRSWIFFAVAPANWQETRLRDTSREQYPKDSK